MDLPVPPSKELIHVLGLIRVFKEVENTVVKELGVGHFICATENRG
jgi:hypothetical protein